MSEIVHLTQYTLAEEPVMKEPAERIPEREHQALTKWEKTYDALQLTTSIYYYSNVPVDVPYIYPNDDVGNRLLAIEAIYTFSDVGWRYAQDGEYITDFCGKRGQVDSSFTAPTANIYQLVPAVFERESRTIFAFSNNSCYNPARIRHELGGYLMVIPNDLRGAYGDNSGSFDLKVELRETPID